MVTFMVKLSDVIIGSDRGRKEFTRIEQLTDSIRKYGLIHPIVVSPSEDRPGKFVLVAGERRYRASIMAARAEVPATLREESPSVLAEIELEENVSRADISFEEEGNILRKIQELKRKEDPKWGLQETADMTGRSIGDVSTKIAIAKKFKDRPDLKEKCKDLPYTAALKKIKQIEESERLQRLTERGEVELSTDLRHGNCLDLIKELATDSVDLLVTDPPYGIEKLEQLRKPGSKKMVGHQLMSDTHNLSLKGALDLIAALAPELARVMKPGAHFYMFCGMQYTSDFVRALEPHLIFKPPQLVWNRLKPSMPAYGYAYLSCMEAVIFGMAPPENTKRLNETQYALFECKDVPSNLRHYPTEKPVPLLQQFIKNSSNPNDVVLDPFAGSASTLVAARTTGRRAIGFEIDQQAFLLAQKRLKEEEI
jgi:site-specific DNA-methyltransferase (adenine-specific)